MIVPIQKTSFGETNIINLQVYPNPTRAHVSLELAEQENKINEIYIFDSSGRLVKRIRGLDVSRGEGLYQFNTYGMEEGIYHLKVRINNTETYNYQLLVRK